MTYHVVNPSNKGVSRAINHTGATLTLDPLLHSDRTILLSRAAGIAVTLPPATGSGVEFRLIVGTTFTGAAAVVVTGNDIMKGTALLFQDGGDAVIGFATAADTDTVDLFETGNTTGGIAGAHLVLVDIAADTWFVHYVSDAAGSEATPFAATIT